MSFRASMGVWCKGARYRKVVYSGTVSQFRLSCETLKDADDAYLYTILAV